MDKTQRTAWAREVLELALANLDSYAARTALPEQELGDLAREAPADAYGDVLELVLTGGLPVHDEESAQRAIWEIAGWVALSTDRMQWDKHAQALSRQLFHLCLADEGPDCPLCGR